MANSSRINLLPALRGFLRRPLAGQAVPHGLPTSTLSGTRSFTNAKQLAMASSQRFAVPDLWNSSIMERSTIARVQQLLNENNVESLLWGHQLLSLFGIPTGLWEISFVVEQHKLEEACSVLTNGTGLHRCVDPKCGFNTMDTKPGDQDIQDPTAHFHTNSGGYFLRPEDRATIRLFLKENCLWELQGFGNGTNHVDGPQGDIMLASDGSLPALLDVPFDMDTQWGYRYSESIPPVRIPTPHRMLEALILLELGSTKYSSAERCWSQQLNYFFKYTVPRKIVDLSLVSPDFFAVIQARRTLKSHKEWLSIGKKILSVRLRKGSYQ